MTVTNALLFFAGFLSVIPFVHICCFYYSVSAGGFDEFSLI